MKKIIAFVISLSCALSLVACTTETNSSIDSVSVSSQNESSTTVENTSSTSGKQEDNTSSNLPEVSFDNVTSLEDFANKLEEDGYKPVIEERDDGTVIIDLEKKPEKDDEKTTDTISKPAIPTIDNIEKTKDPEPVTPAPEPAPDPETPTPTPEPETPSPSPTPTPTPEPTPTPTPIEPEKPKQPEYTYTTGQTHKKLHYSKRYLYSILTAEQKEWYQAIDKAVNNLDAEVHINSNLSIDRNYYIFYTYLFDNPEHFYLCNAIGLCNNGDGTTTLNFYYSVGKEKGEYCGYGYDPLTDELREKIRAKKATFEQEAHRILSTIPADAPDVWKERLIYDRILIDGYYNLNAKWDGLANDNWTAYGLLVNKYGVCESYAEAFQTLCLYAGIKCTGVVGTAGGGHKWNAVELDGEWYMCDITFDDPIGGEAGAAYHYYFNRTSQWLKESNHDWTNCDFSVPECDGTKYDFDTYFGTSRWG